MLDVPGSHEFNGDSHCQEHIPLGSGAVIAKITEIPTMYNAYGLPNHNKYALGVHYRNHAIPQPKENHVKNITGFVPE
eukprot:6974981-Karenia_brevis.AAC.1